MTRTVAAARWMVILFVAFATAAALLSAAPAQAAQAHPTAESAMVSRINQERTARGLGRLRLNLQMTRLGREWSKTMAKHNSVYHRPNLADQIIGPYVRIGENVGVAKLTGASTTELVDRLHRAFMDSSGHRSQILGRYNQVGVGIHRASDGAMWVAVNFLQGRLGAFPLYRDIDGAGYEAAVGQLYYKGMSRGCTRERYCARKTASRRWMAKLVNRSTGTKRGTEWLASRCGGRKACSTGDARRLDTAKAFAYALRLEPVAGASFADLRGENARIAESVIRAKIMGGCSGDRFCPGRSLTRGRLSNFAYRAHR